MVAEGLDSCQDRGDDHDQAEHHKHNGQDALDHGVAYHCFHGRLGLGGAEGGLAVGQRLRAMMPWITKNKLVDTARN